MPQSRSTRAELLGATAAGLIVVAFCFILLWNDPGVFWNDDYQLSILPVFADVARSWNEGHWPLLSPYSWVCSNLAGEFQYGTFSIFVNAAVVLIWKLPLGFAQQAAALSITHLFVLAMGAFLLARDRKLSIPLSIFVALVATLNGWIICWGAIDWFGALGALTWLPWAWWGLERALDQQRSRCRFLWPAPFVYLVVTGGFPYTVVMLALLVVWLSLRSFIETRTVLPIFPMLAGVALGFGLSAPAWLAIFDYVRGSAREMQPKSAHWQWIVPLRALPGFILPSWTVNWADFSTRMMPHAATELACGLVPPAALLAGLIARGRTLVRQIRWELLLLLLVLLLATLPSAGMFRWSFRWLPFVHLILVLCAAEALRVSLPESATAATVARFPGVLGLCLVAIVAVAMKIFHLEGEYAFPLTWIFLGLAALWAVSDVVARNSQLGMWTPTFIAFASFVATYLCISPNCGVPKYNLSHELTNPAPLDPQRLYLSIYPPAEHTYRVEAEPGPVGQIVRPGSTSMWAALRLINGYSPIRAAGVPREFKFAIHGEIDPEIGKLLLHDSGVLAELGIDGIIVARSWGGPQPSSEWELEFSNNEGTVYHRRGGPYQRVRSISWLNLDQEEEFVIPTISRINESRNRVEVNIDVPSEGNAALLKFSRPYFPGYIARVGSEKLAVRSYRGLVPIVEVPAGSRGKLVLSYRPWWLVYGGVVSILCAAFFFIASLFAAREKIHHSFVIRH